MLDIKWIRDQPEEVKERLQWRGLDGSAVDAVLAIDLERRRIITEVERLKSERNSITKEIGVRKHQGKPADDLLAGMKEFSEQIAELDTKCSEVDARQREILLSIPNAPLPGCPRGTGAEDNPEVGRFGIAPEFSFQPREHVALVEAGGWVDFQRAAAMSGSGFAVFQGGGARLERALIQFMLDLHTREHGYTEVSPPFLVREQAMVGTGQLPKFREEMFGTDDGLFLIPTAEVPVTNLFRETILSEAELPIKRVAYTPCFRREAGSAGKESRGLIRMHQFDKVELVRVVHPDQSSGALEELRGEAQAVLERLGLHYRTIELCGGDLGFGAAKCYDIEVWAPGSQLFLEVSSCSCFTDYQARRMNLRFKGADKKNYFPHTLNGSGTALPRLFVAIIESGQQADGSVKLPEALHPYFGDEVLRPNT